MQLLEAEVLARRDSAVARLLREARFPDLRTLEQLQWEALQGVERAQLAQLASCEYLERAPTTCVAEERKRSKGSNGERALLGPEQPADRRGRDRRRG